MYSAVILILTLSCYCLASSAGPEVRPNDLSGPLGLTKEQQQYDEAPILEYEMQLEEFEFPGELIFSNDYNAVDDGISNSVNATTPPDDEETTLPEENETTLGDDNETTPDDDSRSTPGEDNETTPGDDSRSTPGEDNETTPGEGNETTPGEDNETTPSDDNETTRGDSTGTVPADSTTTNVYTTADPGVPPEMSTSYSSTPYPQYAIGGPCDSISLACAVPNSECVGNVCTCLNGFFPETATSCKRTIGFSCSTDKDCVGNSSCPNSIKRCTCNENYAEANDGMKCGLVLGQNCTTSSDCIDNAACDVSSDVRQCQCNFLYVPSDDGTHCNSGTLLSISQATVVVILAHIANSFYLN